jgi:hypothetical protein
VSFRFRKSAKIAPGIRVTVGKSSSGISFGGTGGGISINSKTGVKARVSVPGTGISYTSKLSGQTKSRQSHHDEDVWYDERNEFTLFLDEDQLVTLNDDAFLEYSKMALAAGEFVTPQTDAAYVSSLTRQLKLIDEESNRRFPQKRTFKEDAVKNRYLFLAVAVCFATSSVLSFMGVSALIGLLTAVVAAMNGIIALLGFIGRHDGAKSQ